MAELVVHASPMTLGDRLARPPQAGVRLLWLGQAGFVLEAAGIRIVIDPYLSDSLAIKYRGGRFSHERMMPPPVAPDQLGQVDFVLATHAHTDHMDPDTLRALFVTSPMAKLVTPSAVAQVAAERSGLPRERLVPTAAGEQIDLGPGVRLWPVPAAHETRERDAAGHDRFLGYVLDVPGSRIWHSGDCVPFPELVGIVSALAPMVALLPVNGRRPELSGNGVPGNFTLSEAIDTTKAVGAGTLLAHHYGMFAFNSIPAETIDAIAAATAGPRIVRAQMGVIFEIR